MSKPRKGVERRTKAVARTESAAYSDLVGGIATVLAEARRASARAVNALITATYWEIGRRIVEYEQRGRERAEYGQVLIERLSADLTRRFGRGFAVRNVWQMKAFYLAWPILQTLSAESGSAASFPVRTSARFPLPWSAYVRLLAVKNEQARSFYEAEALRAGWSVRQLDRQIQSQFYERTALSRNKAVMLAKGARAQPADAISPEEEIKDPYVLEFLASPMPMPGRCTPI